LASDPLERTRMPLFSGIRMPARPVAAVLLSPIYMPDDV
jgi:hypothetical protein